MDFGRDGSPLGIEITSPSTFSVEALNAVLAELGEPPAGDGEVAPLLAEAGMMSQDARAGCVRCQACSALSTFERAFGGGRDGVPVREA